MTTTDPGAATPRSGYGDVSIRLPGQSPGIAIGFGLLFTGFLTYFAVSAVRDGQPGLVLVAVGMDALMWLITWRNATIGISSRGDTLTVRRPFSTRRLHRTDIAAVERGVAESAIRQPALLIRTTSGDELVLPPTSPRLLPFGRGADADVDAQVAEVRGWWQAG